MSGFDPHWLDLREAADHAARSPGLLAKVASAFRGRDLVTVADLGAGSGSTLRALAPHLGPRQRWTLLDHDPVLLAHARDRLIAWADASASSPPPLPCGERRGGAGSGSGAPAGGRATADAALHSEPPTPGKREGESALFLRKGAIEIEVVFAQCDLIADPLPTAAASADLVTASALFDLVGEAWLEAFVDRLVAAARPLYAALNFDGSKLFSPPHPADEAVLAAFNAHQRIDKGFGPALGAEAWRRLSTLAQAKGYAAAVAPSPWRLGPADAALTGALAEGVAVAAAEMAEPPSDLADWIAFRRANCAGAEVGHADLWLTCAD